jgi:uncharacterized protein
MQLTISSLIGIIVLGVAAGLLSGMVGIGGGIVIVPALVMVFGLSQQTAQGTTLAMLSFPVSLVGAWTYYKNGMVDWKVAIILCIGFVVGGYFGSRYAVSISALTIKKYFAVLMIIIAIKFLFFDKK